MNVKKGIVIILVLCSIFCNLSNAKIDPKTIAGLWLFDKETKGMLDEVKIWNEAIGEDKIKADMAPAPVNSLGKLAVTWGKIKR